MGARSGNDTGLKKLLRSARHAASRGGKTKRRLYSTRHVVTPRGRQKYEPTPTHHVATPGGANKSADPVGVWKPLFLGSGVFSSTTTTEPCIRQDAWAEECTNGNSSGKS
ncbi:unnamed protein product [Prorocentrum cordatum]|uniref:Uncharacterized protein n=1 Tax=Prorocentrum cordatum TaxID=2364126 RepID=A0ABN9RUU4_9DINO|nr:unnamed protein product [Polarella glacialis]